MEATKLPVDRWNHVAATHLMRMRYVLLLADGNPRHPMSALIHDQREIIPSLMHALRQLFHKVKLFRLSRRHGFGAESRIASRSQLRRARLRFIKHRTAWRLPEEVQMMWNVALLSSCCSRIRIRPSGQLSRLDLGRSCYFNIFYNTAIVVETSGVSIVTLRSTLAHH